MMFSQRVFCGQLTADDIGRKVQLAGWVDALRDHGGLLFVHLRDRSGIMQIVFSPDAAPDVCQKAEFLRAEYCIAVKGEVTKRLAGTENPHIETGTIELVVTELTVLSESDALPFSVSEKTMVAGSASTAGTGRVSEDLRLQYRYLDMRRQSMRDNVMLRHRIFKCV
ncbi:MAG: OB-fold nucleic acid binding domain-containing protein, partial [Desulfosalsimonas sp.]|uniref:OB-fold nucleic acid binding domain-containing protein n=1 Tax=Desulfosalsimonas sp. TaxID=3073848 RepID=UPI0039708EA0